MPSNCVIARSLTRRTDEAIQLDGHGAPRAPANEHAVVIASPLAGAVIPLKFWLNGHGASLLAMTNLVYLDPPSGARAWFAVSQ